MMKKVFTMVLSMVLPVAVWSADGDTFTNNTTEGVSLVYTVISEANKTCETGKQTSLPAQGTVTVPSEANGYKVIGVGYRTFRNFQIAKVILPSTITYISEEAFEGCGKLASINIPNGVTIIYRQAFKDCTSLSSINIPGTVKQLNTECFRQCTGLTSVTLEEGVETIGDGAFSGCTALSSISFPSTISTIYSSSFTSTAWLTNLPTGLTYVGNIAFKYKSPASGSAVIIKNGTTKIQAGAFSGSNITSITFPSDGKFKEIGPNAFGNCKGLETLYLPASITSIGDYAFEYCDNLSTITVEHTTPLAISPETFSNQEKTCLNVPEGSKEAYLKAEVWKEFLIRQPSDPEKFSGGSGTESDPYLISTPGDMKELSVDVNSGNSYDGKYFKVTQPEIDFTGFNYTPIGRQESMPFSGIFDGQNTLIKGITINIEDNYLKYYNSIGIFGYLGKNGNVSNISIDESCTFQGTYDVGGIAGASKGIISNCINKGCIAASKNRIGGICGDNMGIIEKCSNYGSVSTTNPDPGMIGGIAGDCDCGTIQSCTNYGKVSAKDSQVGGIVGLILTGNAGQAIIENCTNKGDVQGTYHTGGISGHITAYKKNSITIRNCLVSGCTIESNGTEYKDAGAICCNDYDILSENYYTTDVIVFEGSNTYSGLMARGTARNQNVVEDNGAMPRIVFNELFAQNDEGQYEIQSVNNMILLRDIVNEADNTCEGMTFKVTAKELNFNNQSLTIGIYLYQMYTENGITHNKTYKPFAGTFDGNGVLIKNLALKNDSYNKYYGLGLFAYNKGVIKNVTIDESCTISSQSLYLGGIVAVNDGVIEGCINKASISGYNYVGGIAGTSSVKIQGCTNSGTISGSDDIGGIVGRNSGEVFECENANTVNIASTNNTGGGITAINSGTVRACANNGNITAKRPSNYDESKNKSIAGIAGTNSAEGTLAGNIVLGGVFTNASGAVVGTNSGTLQNNLYKTINVSGINKGCYDGDISENYGAVKGYAITAGENVTIEEPSEGEGIVSYKGKSYFSSDITVNLALAYNGDVPGGNEVFYMYNGNRLEKNEDGTFAVPVSSSAHTIFAEVQPVTVSTSWTVTSTDDIPAGTKYELDDITLTIGEAGSPDFRVDPERGAYDETFEYPIIGNEVNGNKEGGTFYLFTPKKNGNLTVVVNQNKIKEFYVEESGRVMDAFNGITKEDEVTEGNYIGTYTIPVFANLTYKIYCAGSKMGFYGFTFEGRNDADKTNITFADEKVKALCIANWDTDHNGELSMAEAAAVTTIGEIFKENEEITSFDELRFFTGLTELTGACFYTCTKLKSITIPSGITNIAGGYAFGNCTELEQISVDAGNTAFDSRLQCNAIIETASNTLVVGCQTTNIPATVTAIGGAAFWGRWGMSWMDIPESVSSIDYAAFAYCPNLWSIQLPKGLTHIGEDAFNESNLTEVKVQNPVPVVLENANTFSNRANATLYVPVGSKAAYEAADIWKEFGKIVETGWAVTGTDDIPSGTKVELDDITMTIGQAGSPDFTVDPNAAYDETFKNYIAGNEVNGDREGGTFYLFTPKKNGDLTVVVRQNVRSQKKFYVEESGRVMDAFNGILPENTDNVYIGTYTIPVFANLTYKIYCAGSKMGFYGFTFEGRDDAEWTNIEFADEKVKALCVANWDTDHNGELSMTEAAAVTDLGEVFKQNEEITSFDELRFFTGLTDIPGWNTFNSCHSLTSVTIPASVTSIEGATFANCEALEHISVDPSNTKYCTLQNCNAIIERETNKLVVGCKAAEIPDGVTVIGTEAFHGSTLIQWIGIPESVTELEAGAFAWCISLEGVEIPSSVTKIGDWAFHQTALWSVTLPEKLTTIGENAFKDCNNLNEVKILNPDPVVLTNAETFSNRTNATLYVPNKSIATYKEANIWKDFNEIVGLYTNQIYSDDVTAYLGCPTEMAINLENEETYTAFQFDLVLPEGITLEKDEKGNVVFTKGNRYSGSRSISITPHEGNMYRIVSASMKNNEITGNSGALLTVSLLADESMEKKTYTANIENVILTKPDESQLEARSSTININTKEVLYGDSNDDGNVNVTDAVVSINNILGRPSDKFNKTQADINRDHIVDIFDVYLGLNIVRNKVRMMSRGVNGSDDKLSISDFTITPGETKQLQIELTNEASYAGFQFDLVLPEGISMTGYSVNQTRIPEEIEVDMEQTDGCYRFIAAGFGTDEISGTSGSIMKITVKADENLKGRNLTGCLRDVKLSKLDGTGTTDKETAFNISNPTSGDMNGNSKLDKEDISEIVSLIMSGAYNAKADLNGDDKVNAADLVLITNEVKEK